MDVESAHMSLEAGVLNRQQMGISARFIVAGMPPTRGCHEYRGGFPIGATRAHDITIVVQLLAHEAVTAGLAVNDQVQRHGPMTVRQLNSAFRQHTIHGPEHMCDGLGLFEILIGEQHADATARSGTRIALDLFQFAVCLLVLVQCRLETGCIGSGAQVG